MGARYIKNHDPKPGDVLGVYDREMRSVTGRFIDACGTPYVIYTVERRIPLSAWKRWMWRTGAYPIK